MHDIKTLEIAGTEYPVCFSGRALKYVSLKYGNVNKMVDDIDDHASNLQVDQIETIYKMLWLILQSGEKKAKKMCYDFPSLEEDELWDLVGVDEFSRIWGEIGAIMQADGTPNIQVESPNPEATQTETPERTSDQ